jgi:hypothetical protein
MIKLKAFLYPWIEGTFVKVRLTGRILSRSR